jgi:hypothetical protein
MLHSQILPADNHPIYTWKLPTHVNRTTDASWKAEDVGKICWIEADNTYWILIGRTQDPTHLGSYFGVWKNITTADVAATPDATPGAVVLRDQSGSFAAVNITATNVTATTVNGRLIGNADTATKLATARTIGITGAVTGSASFDGSGNISIATVTNGIVLGTNTTGDYVARGAVSGLGLSGTATGASSTFTVTSNATAANTPGTLVIRDGSGNFAANVITANQFNGPINGSVTGGSGNADKLTTARTIALSGDVVGSASFDGSADITITTVVQQNSVQLGADTIGNYVDSIVAGMGITLSDIARAGSIPTIATVQDIATTASPTFAGLTVSSTINGNAATASAFQTPRLVNGTSFDGSADITFYDTFATGNKSPGPQTFPSNTIRGFDAYSSTDFPASYFSGLTISGGGGVRSSQLAMNWNSEEAAPTGIYFRTNDDTTDITQWSAWQRIATLSDLRDVQSGVNGAFVLKTGDTMTGDLTIQGALSATTKNFLIPHPTKPNMTLRHGSLEGPENGVYVRGKTTTSVIELPEYWTKLVDPESITVSLTAIGYPQHLMVVGVSDNKVFIINGADTGAINCYYHIFAERIDVEQLQIEAPDRV